MPYGISDEEFRKHSRQLPAATGRGGTTLVPIPFKGSVRVKETHYNQDGEDGDSLGEMGVAGSKLTESSISEVTDRALNSLELSLLAEDTAQKFAQHLISLAEAIEHSSRNYGDKPITIDFEKGGVEDLARKLYSPSDEKLHEYLVTMQTICAMSYLPEKERGIANAMYTMLEQEEKSRREPKPTEFRVPRVEGRALNSSGLSLLAEDTAQEFVQHLRSLAEEVTYYNQRHGDNSRAINFEEEWAEDLARKLYSPSDGELRELLVNMRAVGALNHIPWKERGIAYAMYTMLDAMLEQEEKSRQERKQAKRRKKGKTQKN